MAVLKKRHLAKAVTWRIMASFITFITTYVITGSWKVGLSIGAADTIIKLIAYYVHERAWYKTRWGIQAQPGEVPWFTEKHV